MLPADGMMAAHAWSSAPPMAAQANATALQQIAVGKLSKWVILD
jgi:hypothetical protein